MAHGLEIIDGKASMVYVGDVPWHGLGTSVEAGVSPTEMMKIANLDWEVEKHDLSVEVNGSTINTNKSALIRSSDSKLLDVVSNDWKPVQNQEAFDFFNDFVEVGNMEMHTAGALDDGRIVWALAKINESFEPVKGDLIESNLLFTNPHQYGKSVDVRITPVRVVCQNTLSLALAGQKNKTVIKVNHRSAFDSEAIKNSLKQVSKSFNNYKEGSTFLSNKKITPQEIHEYVTNLFPTNSDKTDAISRPAKAILGAMETQPGVEFGQGTWWQAFNGVTYGVDHLIGNSVDTRLKSAWFGGNANKKVEAYKKALEGAK